MTSLHANQPTQATDRIELLDALRGFALLGILFVNLTWFTGFATLSIDQRLELSTARPDAVVSWLIHFLVEGKFWSLFAFLFGVGAAVQMNRLIRRGRSFEGFFARRMLVLLAIGLAHAVFIWFGDIVSLYAVVGFTLLFFTRRTDRAVLTWGFVFLSLPVVQSGVWLFIERATQHGGVTNEDPGYGPANLLATFGSGTYAEAFTANWAFLKERWHLAIYEGRFFKLLGMFLIGFWIGRRGLLHDPREHRRLLFRVLAVGLLTGIPANAASAALADAVSMRPSTFDGWILGALRSVGFPSLCLAYVAAAALLFSTGQRSRISRALASVGRMSLTNYAMQSVIGVTLFYGYGFGLWGKLGSTWLVVLATMIFSAQAFASALWLNRFRYGPLEWVWRCLTYGRPLPLRRETTPHGKRTHGVPYVGDC